MKVSDNSRTDRVGVQMVGMQFERVGYIFREQSISDYGIDAQLEIIEDENATGKLIAVQIKSGNSFFREEVEGGYVFRGDHQHLKYWLNHSLPVLIVLCDTNNQLCYWQAVTPGNIIFTAKAWKIIIPKYQSINSGMNIDLKRLVSKLPVHKSYTISSTEDVSHGAAKRYSLKLILNREHTQAEIIELIKVATKEVGNCEYYRSAITREHWRMHPAHVVWLFLYPTAEDERNNNWLCSSEWFSEILSFEFRPASNNGMEISPNLKVVWNDSYLTTSRWNAKNTIDKEMFIQKVVNVGEYIRPIIFEAEKLFKLYSDAEIDFCTWYKSMTPLYKKIDDIYSSGLEIGLSPFECKDISIKFQSLIAHAHNVFLPFSGIGNLMSESESSFNVKSQIAYYEQALVGFEFELEKVR